MIGAQRKGIAEATSVSNDAVMPKANVFHLDYCQARYALHECRYERGLWV